MIVPFRNTIGRYLPTVIPLLGSMVLVWTDANAAPMRLTIPPINKVQQVTKPAQFAPIGVARFQAEECLPVRNAHLFLDRSMAGRQTDPLQSLIEVVHNQQEGVAQAGLIRAFTTLASASSIVLVRPPEHEDTAITQFAESTPPQPEKKEYRTASILPPERPAPSSYRIAGAIIKKEEIHIPPAPDVEPPPKSMHDHLAKVIPTLAQEAIIETKTAEPVILMASDGSTDFSTLEPAAGSESIDDNEPIILFPTLDEGDELAAKKPAAPVAQTPPAPVAEQPPATTAPVAQTPPAPVAKQPPATTAPVAQTPTSPANVPTPAAATPPATQTQAAPLPHDKQQPHPQQRPQQNAQQQRPPQGQRPQQNAQQQHPPQGGPQEQRPQQNVQQQRPQQNHAQQNRTPPKQAAAPKRIARKPVPKKTEERPIIRAAEHPNLFAQPVVEVNPLPEALGAGTQTTQNLSPESRRILNDLPAGIDRKPPTPGIQPLRVDRTTRNEALAKPPSDDAATPEENVGLKMANAKPRIDVNYELQRAYDAHQAGNSAAAADIYGQVLDTNPNNTQALLGLATSYHRLGRIEKARPLYGKLLAIDRNNRAGLNNFLLLLADESPKEALEQLQSLEAQNPDFAAIPAQMAAIYQKLGQPREAIESIARAIRLSPNNMNYRYNLAILLDHQRNYAQAATLYTQILEAHSRGERIPGDPRRIQERLTFIRSNRR